jgi:hypothetical protein
MRFIARYKHIENQELEYYRTIDADSLNEGLKIADRYARKGYRAVKVQQDNRKDYL